MGAVWGAGGKRDRKVLMDWFRGYDLTNAKYGVRMSEKKRVDGFVEQRRSCARAQGTGQKHARHSDIPGR